MTTGTSSASRGSSPDGRYVLHFALPEEHYNKFPRLLGGVKKAA